MQEEEKDAEEGRRPVGVPNAPVVTEKERCEHELTHMPFRAGCPHCVRGRGRNRPHLRRRGCPEDELHVPRVCLDYFFAGDSDHKAAENPILVMVDEDTGEKFARKGGQKGVGIEGQMDWRSDDLHRELLAWGHAGGAGGQLIIKTDVEPAIVAVRECLARRHGGRIVPEKPAIGEKKSNGVAEEAGKTVRDVALTLKDHLEHEAKITLKPGDVITEWLFRWAAMIASRFLVGSDGRTAYERRRGRACRVPTACFGETVFYKQLHAGARAEKFASDWHFGLFLGTLPRFQRGAHRDARGRGTQLRAQAAAGGQEMARRQSSSHEGYAAPAGPVARRRPGAREGEVR